MGKSFRFGRVAGIPLFLHWTFLLVPAWVLLSGLVSGKLTAEVLLDLSLVGIVFSCVVLHELGHALAARQFGIQTQDIILMPIGGVARLRGMPRNWSQELIVAVAGPAVNVAIAGILLLLCLPTVGWTALTTSGSLAAAIVVNTVYLNVAMVLFNLLPVFPMDGGRVMRALLSGWLGHLRATRIAAATGQMLAVVLGLSGLFVFNNPMLLLIAAFVYFGASQESGLAETEAAFEGLTVGDAMMKQFDVLPANTSVGWALKFAVTSHSSTLPVVSDGRFLGFVTVDDLAQAAASGQSHLAVSRICHNGKPVLQPGDSLFRALQQFAESPVQCLPVTNSAGYLVGLLNPRSIRQARRFSTLLRSRDFSTFRESPDELREHLGRMQL